MKRSTFLLVISIVALLATACGSINISLPKLLTKPTVQPKPTLSPDRLAQLGCNIPINGQNIIVPTSVDTNPPDMPDANTHTYTYMGGDNVLWTTSVNCHLESELDLSNWAIIDSMPSVLPSYAPAQSYNCLGTTFTITPGALVVGQPVCKPVVGDNNPPQLVADLSDGTQVLLTYTIFPGHYFIDPTGHTAFTPGPFLWASVRTSDPKTGDVTPLICGYHMSWTTLKPYVFLNLPVPAGEEVKINDLNATYQSICAGNGFTVQMTTK